MKESWTFRRCSHSYFLWSLIDPEPQVSCFLQSDLIFFVFASFIVFALKCRRAFIVFATRLTRRFRQNTSVGLRTLLSSTGLESGSAGSFDYEGRSQKYLNTQRPQEKLLVALALEGKLDFSALQPLVVFVVSYRPRTPGKLLSSIRYNFLRLRIFHRLRT